MIVLRRHSENIHNLNTQIVNTQKENIPVGEFLTQFRRSSTLTDLSGCLTGVKRSDRLMLSTGLVQMLHNGMDERCGSEQYYRRLGAVYGLYL